MKENLMIMGQLKPNYCHLIVTKNQFDLTLNIFQKNTNTPRLLVFIDKLPTLPTH